MSLGALPVVPTYPTTSPALTLLPFAQALRVAVQVRVVVAERAAGVVLIDGDAAAHADEQLADDAGLHGAHRRAARREDVDRFVTAFAARLVEAWLQRGVGHAVDRDPQALLAQDLQIRAADVGDAAASGGVVAGPMAGAVVHDFGLARRGDIVGRRPWHHGGAEPRR